MPDKAEEAPAPVTEGFSWTNPVVAAEGDTATDATESEEAKKPAESLAVNCAIILQSRKHFAFSMHT